MDPSAIRRRDTFPGPELQGMTTRMMRRNRMWLLEKNKINVFEYVTHLIIEIFKPSWKLVTLVKLPNCQTSNLL